MNKIVLSAVALLSMGMVAAACAAQTSQSQSSQSMPLPLLAQARTAVEQHQQQQAYQLVDHAQDVWEKNNGAWNWNPYLASEPDELRQMARAKQAIQMQNWKAAEYYIDAAATAPTMVTPGPN